MPVQYWHWLQGVVVGRTVNNGLSVDHCPAPCLGYSFKNSQPVLPEIQDRFPVTLSLAVGAAIIWLIVGVSIGVLSALKRGSFFDRFGDDVRARRRLAADLLDRAGLACPSSATSWAGRHRGRRTRHSRENPAKWAHALLLPWITLALAVLRAVRPADEGGHARDHG